MTQRREGATIDADYTQTPFGTWRVTITSPAGTDVVEGTGALPDVVEEIVMPVVQDHTDRIGGGCVTIHTLDGDASAFSPAYYAAGGMRDGWHHH